MTVLVLMSAVVPTTGHCDLIEFAANATEDRVVVLITGLYDEPINPHTRAQLLDQALKARNPDIDHVQFITVVDNDVSQIPSQNPLGFWQEWHDFIKLHADYPYSLVVASEPYGANIAEVLGAKFLPFDINRQINPARGTEVRENLLDNWNSLIPPVQERFQIRAVFFGQESVGKTTLSRAVAERLGEQASWLPEYARPYLEFVGSAITERKMYSIWEGQSALQRMVKTTPFVCLDTDLFSTLGYWKMWNTSAHQPGLKALTFEAEHGKADVYYLLPDDIPFEQDPLRYGGDVRETDIGYWEELLLDSKILPVPVPEGLSFDQKVEFVVDDMYNRFQYKTKAIREHQRA